jgi:hypothetical protein
MVSCGLSTGFCLHWAVPLLAAACTVHASTLLTQPQLPLLLSTCHASGAAAAAAAVAVAVLPLSKGSCVQRTRLQLLLVSHDMVSFPGLSACFRLHWAVALLAAVCTVHASTLLTNPQLPSLLLGDDNVNLLRTEVTHHHQHLRASSNSSATQQMAQHKHS